MPVAIPISAPNPNSPPSANCVEAFHITIALSTWFLGAVGDEQERRVDVALSFLDPKRHYRAEVYRDGDDADYRTKPRAMVIETRDVSAKDRLALRIAPGGGAAVRFVVIK